MHTHSNTIWFSDTDLCERVATQRNNITQVFVNVEDVNDNFPEFDTDSLNGAVEEEAEFDTTVTILRVCYFMYTSCNSACIS